MHYYSHNIADFNNATRHLTRVERSLYRDLIELYYDSEQPLDSVDTGRLARRVLAQSEEELEALSYILSEFFINDGAVYHHERCDAEIEKYRANSSAKAKAGKASAEARRIKSEGKKQQKAPINEQKLTPVEQPLNGCATNHKPITNNQELITNTKSIVEAKPQRVDHVQPIFDYWVETMGKTAATKLTKNRIACVSARLKDGYTVDQIKLAITGCAKSPHHMGQNNEGTIYDDLTLICRNGENIERFSENIAKVIPNATYQPANQPTIDSDDTSWADEIISASEQECSSSGQQDFQRLEGNPLGMEAGSFIGFNGGRH